MKHCIKWKFLLAALLSLPFFGRCEKEKEPDFLELGEERVDFTSIKTFKSISVSTNVAGWTAEVPSAEASWCTATLQRTSLKIDVGQNEGIDQREAIITVRAGAVSKQLIVTQLGLKGDVLIDPRDNSTQLTSFRVPRPGSIITFKVTANVDYVIVNEAGSWVRGTEAESAGGGTGEKTFSYTVDGNPDDTTRSGRLVFKKANGEPLKTTLNSDVAVTIVQAGTFEVVQASGIKNDIKIGVISGTASSERTGEGIGRSFDGDASTLYHSAYDNASYPVTLEYNLDPTSASLDYLIYYPRTDGGINGIFKEVQIFVKRRGAADFVKEKEYDFGGLSVATRVDFDSSLHSVEAVRFVVNSGAGDPGNTRALVSCAEMEFYRVNPTNFDPLTLFTGAACDELKPGVTDEDIANCPNPLFRNIAYFVKKGDYPREFRIATYNAYPNPEDAARHNKTATYSKYDNPTGIYVRRGDELVVLVEGMDNHAVSLRIQDLSQSYDAGGILFSADEQGTPEASDAKRLAAAATPLCAHYGSASGSHAKSKAAVRPKSEVVSEPQPNASCPLHNGINKMYAASDGLVYIMYMSSDYQNAPAIKAHFATGQVNGYFDGRRHYQSDWNRLLAAAPYEYFDVIGKYAHLTFPTQSFKTYTGSRGPELISLYDKLVYLEWKFMGLLSSSDEHFEGVGRVPSLYEDPDGYGGRQKNHMYLHVTYGDNFMFASSYHTGYNISTMSTVCSVEALLNESDSRDAIWGPAHEVGHVNQTRPGLKWSGMTEVTTNLHSIYVQSHLNGNEGRLVNTRLQKESMMSEGGHVNRYQKAMNVYMVDKKPHNYTGEDMDLFCKLVPLWQVHLYLTEALGMQGTHGNGIYEDIYEAIRQRPVTDDARNGGWQQLAYVKLVCQKAQLNLEDFFASYGFLTAGTFNIDDYGVSSFTITEEQVNEAKTYISQWPKPTMSKEFQYICDENATLYKSGAEVTPGSGGTYKRGETAFAFPGWGNVVAYRVERGNELRHIFLVAAGQTFRMPKTYDPAQDKVYAISVSGTRTEVPITQE
jgi:hypothetical protein